jgi:ABC-type multidrug transport system ATPase subunit
MALPQARELLGRPLLLAGGPTTPLALVVLRPERVRSRVQRQDGHFVVPVELHPAWSSQELRLDTRRQWDGELARLRLPAAVELQRPALGRLAVRWRPEQLRLAAFAACLPLLLGALALVGVGRVGRAAAVLSPILLGVLAAAPLASRGGGLDERGLFALLAASGGALGALLVFGAELPEGARASGARVYAALRRVRGAPAAGALLAGAVLLVPTVGAGRAPWAAPLRLGGLAAAVAEGSAVLVLPALLVGARAWRRGRSPESRRARHPEVWHPEVAPAPVALRLEARSLVKHYPAQRSALLALVARRNGRRHPARPGVRALDKVTVTLEPGIVGLLGPNGAGKTTLLRILTGILAPTRGGVAFQGVRVGIENLADYRRQIGFLPQGFDAYPGFSAEQFLDYWARERGMRDAVQRSREIERLLVAVGLAEHAQRKVRDFSGGMRQRVGIARALLGAPAMLVVDEPTTGLDLEARRRFREALLAIAERRIIVFSTHIASDVEAVASRLLLLHGGRLRFDGEPRQLVERARGRVFEAIVGDADLVEVAHRYRVTSRVREREGVRVRAVVAPGEALPGAAVEPSLEEAYLAELHGGTSC